MSLCGALIIAGAAAAAIIVAVTAIDNPRFPLNAASHSS